jgi:hypothetical protein
MVHDLRLLAQIAGSGGAVNRAPRCTGETRSEICVCRQLRSSEREIRRPTLAKGTARADTRDCRLGAAGGCAGAAISCGPASRARAGTETDRRGTSAYPAGCSNAAVVTAAATIFQIQRRVDRVRVTAPDRGLLPAAADLAVRLAPPAQTLPKRMLEVIGAGHTQVWGRPRFQPWCRGRSANRTRFCPGRAHPRSS